MTPMSDPLIAAREALADHDANFMYGADRAAAAPEFWHGKEVFVLYTIVADVNDRIQTFYVASEHRSGVEPEVRTAEQDRIVQKLRGVLNTKNVVITTSHWVPV